MDFLARHRQRYANHPRAALLWRQLERMDEAKLAEIRQQAGRLRERLTEEAASSRSE